MNPRTTKAGLGQAGPATTTHSALTKTQDPAQRSAVQIWAAGYEPCADRTYWLVIVARCPACSGAHAHRTGPSGGLRRSGCGRTTYYVLPRAVLTRRGAA